MNTTTRQRPFLPPVRRFAAALALAATLPLAGCSSTPLRLVPGGTTVPLAQGAAPGTMLGRCLRMERSGPTARPCPPSLAKLLDKPIEHDASGRGTYAHGVFVLAEDRASMAAEGAEEVALAFEMATFGSTSVGWKAELDDAGQKALGALCASPDGSTVVIVRELTGCAVAMVGDKLAAAEWTIDSLAQNGAVIGVPKNFWVHEPGLSRAPDNAQCKAKRVVATEVVPISAVCMRFGGTQTAAR